MSRRLILLDIYRAVLMGEGSPFTVFVTVESALNRQLLHGLETQAPRRSGLSNPSIHALLFIVLLNAMYRAREKK